MAGTSRPQSHADVARMLKAQGFDPVTIYRNLIELSKAGILTRVDLGDHVWRFESKRAESPSVRHPHLVCDDCGTVSCLDDVTIRISPKRGIRRPRQVAISGITVTGKCETC